MYMRLALVVYQGRTSCILMAAKPPRQGDLLMDRTLNSLPDQFLKSITMAGPSVVERWHLPITTGSLSPS